MPASSRKLSVPPTPSTAAGAAKSAMSRRHFDMRHRAGAIQACRPTEKEQDIGGKLRILRVFTQADSAQLYTALRAARRAARAGDPAYDPARHAALCRMARTGAGRISPTAKSRGPADVGTRHLDNKKRPAPPCAEPGVHIGGLSDDGDAAGPDPSASPVPNGPPRNWAPPSDNRPAGPTSRDTARGSCCTGCAGGASAT